MLHILLHELSKPNLLILYLLLPVNHELDPIRIILPQPLNLLLHLLLVHSVLLKLRLLRPLENAILLL